MNVLTYWRDAFGGVPDAKSPGEVERHLQVAASDIARFLGEARPSGEVSRYRHEQWALVGVDPLEATLSADGAAFERDGRLRVIVKAKQPKLRQRYTVAHEVGHVLLRQMMASNEALELSVKVEESICDDFAAQILVPSGNLKALMDAMKAPPTTQDLLKWCGELQVNIEPMLIAARKHWRWGAAAMVYCENYAHRRDSEPALRIVGYVADEKLFLPMHKRVASIGLASVNDWFTQTEEPYGTGRQPEVRLPLYTRDMHTRTGQAEGCAEWAAMRMKERNLQGAGRAFIDLRLVGDWSVRWAGGKAEVLDPARLGKGV